MSLLKAAQGRRDRPRAKGPGAVLGALILMASVFGAGYFYLDWARSLQGSRIAGLEALSAKLTAETVPLRFMVLSRGAEGIRVRIRLYDLGGEELVLLEKSLPGSELFFDFLLSPLPGAGGGTDRWLAFPYRVFTDTLPAAEGILLLDSYDRSGFPAVYGRSASGAGGISQGSSEAKALAAVFARARGAAKAGRLPDLGGEGKAGGKVKDKGYGSAVHELSSLSRFEEGLVYKILCRAKGGIEIMEDE